MAMAEPRLAAHAIAREHSGLALVSARAGVTSVGAELLCSEGCQCIPRSAALDRRDALVVRVAEMARVAGARAVPNRRFQTAGCPLRDGFMSRTYGGSSVLERM